MPSIRWAIDLLQIKQPVNVGWAFVLWSALIAWNWSRYYEINADHLKFISFFETLSRHCEVYLHITRLISINSQPRQRTAPDGSEKGHPIRQGQCLCLAENLYVSSKGSEKCCDQVRPKSPHPPIGYRRVTPIVNGWKTSVSDGIRILSSTIAEFAPSISLSDDDNMERNHDKYSDPKKGTGSCYWSLTGFPREPGLTQWIISQPERNARWSFIFATATDSFVILRESSIGLSPQRVCPCFRRDVIRMFVRSTVASFC
jgi:hypothetical protein